VEHVRAEDASGAFGVRPGHDDFVTALAVSVLSWRNHSGEEHHVAVRGGALTVRDGELVEVVTREAVSEDTLAALGPAVLDRLRQKAEEEGGSRTTATRLHLSTIRQLRRYLDSARGNVPVGGMPGFRGRVDMDGVEGPSDD